MKVTSPRLYTSTRIGKYASQICIKTFVDFSGMTANFIFFFYKSKIFRLKWLEIVKLNNEWVLWWKELFYESFLFV